MSKWLTEQLLDVFEHCKQVKNLEPAIVSMSTCWVPIYKKSPKFTSAIKMILLAILKYDRCYMSVSLIAKMASLGKNNTRHHLKLLVQNKIISISRRTAKAGDSETNIYTFNKDIFCAFFNNSNIYLGLNQPRPTEKLSTGVGPNRTHLGPNQTQGGSESDPGVGPIRTPIKQILINNINNQERESPLSACDYFMNKDEEGLAAIINNRSYLNNYVSKKKDVPSSAGEGKKTPFPDDFIPNLENQKLVQQVSTKTGLTVAQLFSKFKNIQLSKEKESAYWDGEYENFLLRERPTLHTASVQSNSNTSSTVQFWGPGHPTWESIYGNKKTEEPKEGSSCNLDQNQQNVIGMPMHRFTEMKQPLNPNPERKEIDQKS